MTSEKNKSIFKSVKKQINKLIGGSVFIWKKRGCPVPPPHKVKEKIIETLAGKHNCRALIETGTYKGDMIKAQLNNFDWLASIELSEQFYLGAKKRFCNVDKVHLYLGDSGEVLSHTIEDVPPDHKICFWLDGHYSGGKTARKSKDTPIIHELNIILDSLLTGVILIDDARCFVGENDYLTIEELKSFVSSKEKAIEMFEVEDDIIRIVF